MSHRIGGAAITAVLTTAMTLILSPAAVAAPGDDVEVSADGVTYASTLPGGILDQITISVPGDSQTTEFWVRNAGPGAAHLRIAIANVVASDPVLTRALSVTASTVAHPGTATTLAAARPCRVLTEGDLLAPGAVVQVTATLALGDLDGLTGQGGRAAFDFQVELSDAVAPLPPTACSSSGTEIPATGGEGDIRLARTGSDVPLLPIMAAASALGAGIYLLVAARRRRGVQA